MVERKDGKKNDLIIFLNNKMYLKIIPKRIKPINNQSRFVKIGKKEKFPQNYSLPSDKKTRLMCCSNFLVMRPQIWGFVCINTIRPKHFYYYRKMCDLISLIKEAMWFVNRFLKIDGGKTGCINVKF